MGRFEFYHDEKVLRRILEYCGVPPDVSQNFSLGRYRGSLAENITLRNIAQHMTCKFLSSDALPKDFGGGHVIRKPRSRETWQLGEILDTQLADPFRSLWDLRSLIFAFDVEYVSKEFKSEPFYHPEEVFLKLEPAYQCIKDTLHGYGIRPLTIMTGQGYHFVWRIDSYCRGESWPGGKVLPLAREMDKIGHIEDTTVSYDSRFTQINPKPRRQVTPELGRGFDAINKILEFIIHETIRGVPKYERDIERFFNKREGELSVPIGIGELDTTRNKMESINADLSQGASSILPRVTRLPFSEYTKHIKKGGNFRPLIILPRFTPCNNHELGLDEMYSNRMNEEHARDYAGAIVTEIPECTAGTENLLNAYRASDLRKFHEDFDKTRHEPRERWHETYYRTDQWVFPDNVQAATRNAYLSDDCSQLLTPSIILHLVRALLRENWHPTHISGYLRAQYDGRNCSINWDKIDPNLYARKWVGWYAALLKFGLLDKQII